MNTHIKAMKQALEALEYYCSFEDCQPTPASKTIPALRRALSNQFNPDWNQIEALQESLREHMAEIHRLRQALDRAEKLGWENGVMSERQRIVNLLMIQHEATKGAHNYWHVAAQLIQADVASET